MKLSRTKIFVLLAGDFGLLWAALASTLLLRYPEEFSKQFHYHLVPFAIVFVAWVTIFGAFGLYDLRFIKNSRRFLLRLLQATAFNFVIAVLFFYLAASFSIEPRRNLALIAAVGTLFVSGWRYLFNLTVEKTAASRILFFGLTREAADLADYLMQNPQLGQRPVGFISNGEPSIDNLPPLPNFSFDPETFTHIVRDALADTIVISRAAKENQALVKALFTIIPLGVSVIEFPAFYEAATGKIPLSLIGEVWFLENLIGQKQPRYEFMKRVFDIILAIAFGAAGVILLPLIVFLMFFSTPRDIFAYKTKRARRGDGIIFFRQKRVGKNGRIFNFVKLRSQVLGAEKMSQALGEAKEAANDPRQYPFGKILRRFYLDEIPQIWNILKGEMSFVGPRPERPEYVEQLKQQVPFYETRLLVAPGITGWAQINMENDAAVEDAPEKMQYDLYYIKHRSPTLDLLIMLRTIAAILRRQGR